VPLFGASQTLASVRRVVSYARCPLGRYYPGGLPRPADLGEDAQKEASLALCAAEARGRGIRPGTCHALVPKESLAVCGVGSGIKPPCWEQRFTRAAVTHLDGSRVIYARDDGNAPTDTKKGETRRRPPPAKRDAEAGFDRVPPLAARGHGAARGGAGAPRRGEPHGRALACERACSAALLARRRDRRAGPGPGRRVCAHWRAAGRGSVHYVVPRAPGHRDPRAAHRQASLRAAGYRLPALLRARLSLALRAHDLLCVVSC
jgi:hypothetical protein